MSKFEAGLEFVRRSPASGGTVELLVRRPAVDEREVVESAVFDTVDGLVGDNWASRGNPRDADPNAQITLVNVGFMALLADRERWPLAGDQVYTDLDLSQENLPAGTLLSIGSAILEVSATPHTGCAKFSQRFGVDALRVANSETGRLLRLRGMNTRVVRSGTVRIGDTITKADASESAPHPDRVSR